MQWWSVCSTKSSLFSSSTVSLLRPFSSVQITESLPKYVLMYYVLLGRGRGRGKYAIGQYTNKNTRIRCRYLFLFLSELRLPMFNFNFSHKSSFVGLFSWHAHCSVGSFSLSVVWALSLISWEGCGLWKAKCPFSKYCWKSSERQDLKSMICKYILYWGIIEFLHWRINVPYLCKFPC